MFQYFTILLLLMILVLGVIVVIRQGKIISNQTLILMDYTRMLTLINEAKNDVSKIDAHVRNPPEDPRAAEVESGLVGLASQIKGVVSTLPNPSTGG